MTDNFYQELLNKLLKLKPMLLSELKRRPMVVRKKSDDIFQVHWKNRVENNFVKIQAEFISILEDYEFFQDSTGKDIREYLSLSEENEIKSILNIYRKDVWFEKDVFSRFKKLDSKFYRFFKDDVQDEIFFENGDKEEEAKKAMINKCREELIDSFEIKFDSVKYYLTLEKNKLDKQISEIKQSKNKSSEFYNFGLGIMKQNPTIAMIILGVSIECTLKTKYSHILRHSYSLGKIIGELERRNRKKHLNLLKDINELYVKAKHEKDTLISEADVILYYQKVSVFF